MLNRYGDLVLACAAEPEDQLMVEAVHDGTTLFRVSEDGVLTDALLTPADLAVLIEFLTARLAALTSKD